MAGRFGSPLAGIGNLVDRLQEVVRAFDKANGHSHDGTMDQGPILSGANYVYNVKAYGAKGDGATDDTAAIQAAIDAAAAGPDGTVLIPQSSGAYIFTAIAVKANVRMQGTGGILKLKDNTCTVAGTSYYLIHNLDGTGGGFANVVLDGLIIDGNKANNATFTVADAITVLGDNVTVRNCHIYNPPDSGIMFSKITNGACCDNRISGATDAGVYVNDGDGTGLHENVIARNRISGCTSAIALKRISQRCIVSENTIYDCGNGITLEHASTTTDFATNLTIVNNRLRYIGYNYVGAGKTAIDLRGCDNVVCNGNRVEDAEYRGIYMQGARYCAVVGNAISGTSSADASYGQGIELTDRAALTRGCTGNVVAANAISDVKVYGIFLTGTTYASSDNVIMGNAVSNSGSNALRVTDKHSNTVVVGNVFDGTTNDANVTTATTGLLVGNNQLTNNTQAGPLGSGVMLERLTCWVADNAQTVGMEVLPANTCVIAVRIHVTEAFNSDGTDLISVGYTADTDAFGTDTDVSATGIKAVTAGVLAGFNDTEREVSAYYTNGGTEPTTGKALVTLEYYRVSAAPA